MLNKMRESASGIFAKILMGILIFSFVIWGIGDIFRGGSDSFNVATVGSLRISLPEYQKALRNKKEDLRRKLGKAYNGDLVNKLGIETIVLQEMINNKLIENDVKHFAINVGDDEIVDEIARNPTFADKNGKFDKNIFVGLLKENGINEVAFGEMLRKDLAQGLLVNTITDGVIVPENLVASLYKSREEQRVADLITLTPSDLKSQVVISEKDLQTYYDANAKLFSTPEARKISYVEIKLADIAASTNISDEEIKQNYQDRIAEFHKPQRFTFEHLLFAKQEDAEKAKTGNFAELAKSENILNKGKISFGTISKKEFNLEGGDAVFALKEGEISKPIKSDFGVHIFRVVKILPEGDAPLAEVRKSIAKELAEKKAGDTANKLATTLEDALAGGSTLEQAADKIGQKIHTLDKIEKTSKNPAIAAYENFLETAFATKEKENSRAITSNDGSYCILRVDGITAEKPRPLAEVKDKITAALKADKTDELLKKTADNIGEDLKAGKKIADITAKYGVTATSSGKIKRSSKESEGKKPLPQELLLELFRSPVDAPSKAYPTANGNYMIAITKQIIAAPATADAKALQKIRDELKNNLADEVFDSYLIYLRSKYKVEINQAMLNNSQDSGE